MWTKFWDMNSGGGMKEKWNLIFIEAPIDEAKVIFYNRFGHSPERVTCTCCGDDYSIEEAETLAEATAYHRNCAYDKTGYLEHGDPERSKWGKGFEYIPLDKYIADGGNPHDYSATFITAQDIKPEERLGSVPEQGYVWVG